MDHIEGTPQVGNKLQVHLTAANGRGVTFKPKVLAATSGRELRWLGRFGLGGLFDGEHFFVLNANADGSTRLTHGEKFSGIFVAAMKGTRQSTDAGFVAFNTALKERVEAARSRGASPLLRQTRSGPLLSRQEEHSACIHPLIDRHHGSGEVRGVRQSI
ncbi:MAG TPA: SRPBCC domain-containing protein [Solirubrobacteraceae bacterium]|nr:SRPBCC domain-containing protein [Solirubrobacteraceae bacterium]